MIKIRSRLGAQGKSFLLFLDLILLLLCTYLVFYFRIGGVEYNFWSSPGLWFICFVQLIFLYLFGSYDIDKAKSIWTLWLRHSLAILLGFIGVIAANYFLQKDRSGLFGRGILFGSFGLFYLVSGFYRSVLSSFFRSHQGKIETLFLISSEWGEVLKADLKKFGLKGSQKILDLREMQESLFDHPWSSVVVGVEAKDWSDKESSILMNARFSGHSILDLNEFYESVWRKIAIYYLGPQWFILSDGFRLVGNPVGVRFKRLFDLILSSLLLLITWPFMVLTAVAIRLESPGGVIYSQIRTGKNGKDFWIYKFRSMRLDAEKNGAQWAQKKDPRITKVGQFIRITRLDELPQLWNVFRGDMSFIGPRPERPEFNLELEKQLPYYNLRHLVRPGITGWAQVLYPYGASVEDAKEKLQYDLYYIKNYSLLLDFHIVLKTIKVVLFGKGR